VQQAPGGVDTAALTEAGAAFADEDAQAFAPQPVAQDAAVDLADAAAAFANEDAQAFAPNPVAQDAAVDLADAAAAFANEDAQAFAPNPVNDPAAAFADEDAQGFGGQTPADIEDAEQGLAMQAALQRAREQATLQQQFAQTNKSNDWRVRLRLAPNAGYLYQAENPGILQPLKTSDGVIFPYLPTVSTRYEASYDAKSLTHSNYQGYFYRSSRVGDIQITGTFTAQDTAEAEYLLAVIHFFRSATKMFYGKDEFRGAPPPLVYLSGFGEFQFNNHPCVISNFTYTLPNSVDYIRVDPNNYSQNLVVSRNQISSSPVNTLESAIRRVQSLVNVATGGSVRPGAAGTVDLGYVNQTVSGTTQTTYVPTKMEIVISLLPVQTRSQISQQFSLQKFASGDLLKGGFW